MQKGDHVAGRLTWLEAVDTWQGRMLLARAHTLMSRWTAARHRAAGQFVSLAPRSAIAARSWAVPHDDAWSDTQAHTFTDDADEPASGPDASPVRRPPGHGSAIGEERHYAPDPPRLPRRGA